MERFDALVVGGGIIGLAAAWRAQQRGLRVCVLERDVPGCGATRVAAGVLAPDPETPEFTALARRSAELWPAFAAELDELTAIDPAYTRCGSFVLAYGDLAAAAAAWPQGDVLDRETLRALEPGVTADCAGGIHMPDDAQVDPRRTVDALTALLGSAVRSRSDVVELQRNAVVLADGTHLGADRVVLAAGAWSSRRLARRLPVYPVKGQTVRLRGPVPATRIIHSEDVYVVPRAGGETVVGATAEDRGYDTEPSGKATALLLDAASRALPAVRRLEVAEAEAGLRPGTPDGGPLLGPWGDDELLVAGGHFRNGILLAPVTAEFVAAVLAGDPPPPEAAPFAPGRFGV